MSLWSWQDAIKAVFLDRVNIIAEYDHAVSSPSFSMRLPSVVSLKTYVQPTRNPALYTLITSSFGTSLSASIVVRGTT